MLKLKRTQRMQCLEALLFLRHANDSSRLFSRCWILWSYGSSSWKDNYPMWRGWDWGESGQGRGWSRAACCLSTFTRTGLAVPAGIALGPLLLAAIKDVGVIPSPPSALERLRQPISLYPVMKGVIKVTLSLCSGTQPAKTPPPTPTPSTWSAGV